MSSKTSRKAAGTDLVIPTRQTFNRFADAANRARAFLEAPTGYNQHKIFATIKNKTGVDYDHHEIIPLGPALYIPSLLGTIDNVDDFPTFESAEETIGTKHYGRWAITHESIQDDDVGLCVIGGVVGVEVTIADINHTNCDVFKSHAEGGSQRLYSNTAGAGRLLHRPTTTGQQNCLIQIGPPGGTIHGILDGNLTKGGSQTIGLLGADSLTVYDDDWLTTGYQLASGTEVVCQFRATMASEGRWIVIAASACEEAV